MAFQPFLVLSRSGDFKRRIVFAPIARSLQPVFFLNILFVSHLDTLVEDFKERSGCPVRCGSLMFLPSNYFDS